VVILTPQPLQSLGKIPRYRLNRRLGGPQNRSGRRGVEKNLPLPGLGLRISALTEDIFSDEIFISTIMMHSSGKKLGYSTVKRSRDSSVGLATGYKLDGQGSIPGRGKFFSITSGPALGPTQPPIHWEPGDLSPGIKRQGRAADHSPSSNAEVRNGATKSPTPPPPVCSWYSA
jgi:hypothetical protein